MRYRAYINAPQISRELPNIGFFGLNIGDTISLFSLIHQIDQSNTCSTKYDTEPFFESKTMNLKKVPIIIVKEDVVTT